MQIMKKAGLSFLVLFCLWAIFSPAAAVGSGQLENGIALRVLGVDEGQVSLGWDFHGTASRYDIYRKEKAPPSGDCFIATAAYGSSLAPPVVVLRRFRDTYLLNSKAGASLVGQYYRYSPSWAGAISQGEVLRGLARLGLLPFTCLASLAVNWPPALAGLIITLLWQQSTRKRRRPARGITASLLVLMMLWAVAAPGPAASQGQAGPTGGYKIIDSSNETSYTDRNVTPGKTYEYIVSAVSPGGRVIAYSDPVSVEVRAAVPVTAVTLDQVALALAVGEAGQLTATVEPADATNKDVTWGSDNPAIATVSGNGLVTAVSAGTAVITVRTVDGNKAATCQVTAAAEIVNAGFYVSASGDDSNDGRSPATPWASLDRVRDALSGGEIKAGDVVGLKAGDAFVGTLNTRKASGAPGAPIVFTSYGPGSKPVITGLVTLEDRWENVGGNVWRYDVSSFPAEHIRYLRRDGTNLKMAQSQDRYAETATGSTFTDSNLAGSNGCYVGSEVMLRTTSYWWENRIVTGYDAGTGTITYSPESYYNLGFTDGISSGGYVFQNSRFILEQNAKENEWAHEGDYLYYYSGTNPYSPSGGIEISSVDVGINIEDSRYLVIDGLRFTYLNHFGIAGGGSDHKQIINCDFERVGGGIFEGQKSSVNSVIDNNTFLDMGGVGIQQHRPVNIRVSNNRLTNIGIELGRMPFLGLFEDLGYGEDAGYNSMWGTGVFAYPEGGIFEYNHLSNLGYSGFLLVDPSNEVLVQYNYVADPCILQVDGGAYYSYSEFQETSSNVNNITFRNNLAAVTGHTNMDYQIGYRQGWMVYGFYKDGFLRATNWDNNFAYGFEYQFFSNPSKHSTWTNNTGIATKVKDGLLRGFAFTDLINEDWNEDREQLFTDNMVTNNIMINAGDLDPVLYVYDAQLESSANNLFNHNRILRPLDATREGMVVSYRWRGDLSGVDIEYLSFDEWINLDAVGAGEGTDVFLFPQSGLTNTEDFIYISINPSKATITVEFPPGYNYHDIDGNIVLEDTLGPYEGKVYLRSILLLDGCTGN